MPHLDDSTAFRPLQLGVITLSDSRTLETDTSGEYLCEALGNAGHTLSRRVLIADDKDLLHSTLIQWSAAPDIDVILTTGGTGITRRDITPEIVESLATKLIPGFGELFRMQSFKSIGTSTIQSRATQPWSLLCPARPVPAEMRGPESWYINWIAASVPVTLLSY
jgi:molybdenum cofactor biosynthesis protein B